MSNSHPRAAAVMGMALGLTSLLSGCAVGPDYSAPELHVPSDWPTRAEIQDRKDRLDTLADWWSQFEDPILDQLVEQAISGSPDRDLALARIQEARARYRISKASSSRNLTADINWSKIESTDPLGNSERRDVYDAGFDASWELDIFGGRRRSIEMAQAVIEARQAEYTDVMTSLIAEVARSYVDIRTLEERLRLTQASFETQRTTFDLIQWRTEAGISTALDVEQARSNLESTRAQIPLLERDLAQSRSKLTFLLGKAPWEYGNLEIMAASIPVAPTDFAIGVPADTLRRRADVRSAERNLAAQSARIGVATANLYPSFRISGSVGSSASGFSDLFDSSSVVTNFIRGISAPIFSGGQLRANVDVEDALFEQSLAQYEMTVLNALKEVEDTLAARFAARERGTSLILAIDAANRALELTTYEYKAGMSNIDRLLESQRTVLSLQDQHALNQSAEVSAVISLFKAVGGGWLAAPEDPTHVGEKS